MSNQETFTQALALRPWYETTPQSVELLQELDKDLKKWDAHVSEESTDEQVCCVIDALFSHVHYRLTLRVHPPVEIRPIDTANLPSQYRGVLKLHQRSRNVLKNFLPIVFDRLNADRQFALVAMHNDGVGLATHCIWATNVAGLGLSIVSTVEPEERDLRVLLDPPMACAPVQQGQPFQGALQQAVH